MPENKYNTLRIYIKKHCQNNKLKNINKIINNNLNIDIYENNISVDYDKPHNYYKDQYITKMYVKFVYILMNDFIKDPLVSKLHYIEKHMFNGLTQNTLLVLLKYFYSYRFNHELSFMSYTKNKKTLNKIDYWNTANFNNFPKYVELVITNKLFGSIIYKLLYEYCIYMNYLTNYITNYLDILKIITKNTL